MAVTFLPRLSGNRDATGRLTLTTDYEALYLLLEAGRASQLGLPADWRSQIELQIRADEIVTAAVFSTAIYAEFNPNWKEQMSQPNRNPPTDQVRSSMGTNSRFCGPM
ncbi:MAG TPA: hypothetical protein VNO35_05160 [Steroidobacteraceae bacterium]|nr:hypothetical protein [Steroidobacteraceae bacterium]